MARELPGYYFDPEKGKYFKVQPNHAVPSAAKYSRQAVDAQRTLVKRRKVDDGAKARHLREKVQPSRLLGHPLMNRLRIRNAIGGLHVFRSNVTAELAAYYGAGLSRRTIQDTQGTRQHFTKFAIEQVTAAMVTASTDAHHLVTHMVHSRRTPNMPYMNDTSVIISAGNSPVTALLITPRPMNYLIWASSSTGLVPAHVQVVPFGQELESASARNPQGHENQSLGLVNYDYIGTSFSIPECDIWDMATSPSGRTVVAASTNGLNIIGGLNGGLGNPMHMDNRMHGKEFMAVSFKEENTILAGMRSGTVHMADIRSHRGIARLRHGNGVTAIRTLSNDNYVAVRGLQTMSIYDLRYTPKPESLSKPYMTFQGSYASDRFGLGFDYDPILGLIATAHSSPSPGLAGQTGHCISLFSTRTGKLIPSPLNTHAFSAPVSCIQFTNAIRARSNASCGSSFPGDIVGDDGRPLENNEPKSIVTASGARIDEWCIQGLGAEDERQE